MKSTQKVTGQQASNNTATVVKDVTQDVYYQEDGYNFFKVLSLGAYEFYLKDFIVPINIYLGAGTTGTLEIFPPQFGGDTIDGDLSITLSNEFDGVTLYYIGGGRYAANYWKVTGAAPSAVNSGSTTLNFGAFPGGQDASVTVTGQTGISSGSIVQAWLSPVATSDHSADEHLMANIKVFAGNISAGVGFTIYGFNNNQLAEPELAKRMSRFSGAGQDAGRGQQKSGQINLGGTIPKIYGEFTVNWTWV